MAGTASMAQQPTEDGREIYPVKPGDWVGSRTDPTEVGTVKAVYFDSSSGECLIDVYLYNRTGERVGRRSPALGGPRTYEPACAYKYWQRIPKPGFPMDLVWLETEDGSKTAGYAEHRVLPDRKWVRPVHKAPAVQASRVSDYNPELEAASRRMAAQELLDIARKYGVEELKERATQLEDEAEAISPRFTKQ